MNNKIIGERIREARIENEKTGIYISTILGIDQSYYSKMEKGKHEIKLETLYRIAELFNISLDYLTGRTNIKEVNR
ncbi:MAG: helix-turn-helix transcriptional regulator [Eubacterium sp.]|nr:helix-turn-helix transcriptional regulator [Eubacterium sp.]